MNIGFLYNLKEIPPSLTNKEAQVYAEFDSPETIGGIQEAIEKGGHKVYRIEANERAYSKLKKLKRGGLIDLVFNIAEGIHGEARESQIPAMLEMLQIPYTGSGPLNLAITLDKARTKEILSYYKIHTPEFIVFRKGDMIKSLKFDYPMIVKPLSEGSSKGIRDNSVVNNKTQLERIVKGVIQEFNQPVIVEELLEGREFTVGIIEADHGPMMLPIIEVSFGHLPAGMNEIDSYDAKWFYDDPEKGIDPLTCPAQITDSLKRKIEKVSLLSALFYFLTRETHNRLCFFLFSSLSSDADNASSCNILKDCIRAGLQKEHFYWQVC